MRFVKFDIRTYNLTKGLSGSPTYTHVEEDVPEIEIITDADGNPTRGGLIGYYLAYGLMAAFVGYIFLVL
ncbi:hypothetical protein [Sphingobium chungangianum]